MKRRLAIKRNFWEKKKVSKRQLKGNYKRSNIGLSDLWRIVNRRIDWLTEHIRQTDELQKIVNRQTNCLISDIKNLKKKNTFKGSILTFLRI